jgi:hypothetical protein
MANENKLPSKLPVLDADRGVHGKLVAFKDRQHLLRDGTLIPPDCAFLGLGQRKVAQRWENGIPIEEIVEQPGEKLDAAAIMPLNDAVPKDEWERGEDGELRPPWSLAYAIYLLDLKDAQICTHINATKGQQVAYATLKEKVEWMSALRGEFVLPVVTLGDELFSKRFRKFRPEFVIIDWRRFGGGPAEPKRLEKPSGSIGEKVAEPTLKEELDDEIPF